MPISASHSGGVNGAPCIENENTSTRGTSECAMIQRPMAIRLVRWAGVPGVMAVAACEDLRRLVIPNRLTLALCVLWPFYIAVAPNLSLAAGGLAAGCAAAVFVAGALLFARGLIGGGDVK